MRIPRHCALWLVLLALSLLAPAFTSSESVAQEPGAAPKEFVPSAEKPKEKAQRVYLGRRVAQPMSHLDRKSVV